MSYIQGLRRFIGHERVITPGVRAIIRDSAGRLLMQRRGDFGTWGLPAGGMELGESVATALTREVAEETGLRIIRATPFGIYSDPSYAVTYPNGDQIQPFTLAFLVDEWSGEPVADGDETLQLTSSPSMPCRPTNRSIPRTAQPSATSSNSSPMATSSSIESPRMLPITDYRLQTALSRLTTHDYPPGALDEAIRYPARPRPGHRRTGDVSRL